MATQREPRLRLWIDGVEVEQISRFVLELEAEERADSASTFRMVLDLNPIDTADGLGDWDLLEQGPFLEGQQGPAMQLMTRVTIAFGLAEDAGTTPTQFATVFDGYVTCMEPSFGENRVADSHLEVSGLDASALMHFTTLSKNWQGISDADIAREIFGKYGFAVTDDSVEDTTPIRAPERGSMVQRCTDAEFLRLLARRNGYETYIATADGEVVSDVHPGETAIGHFHRSRPDGNPVQTALELFPEDAPSLIELSARWESHLPTRAHAWRLDERSRLIERSEVSEPGWQRLGSVPRVDALRDRLEQLSYGAQASTTNTEQTAPDRLEAVEIHTDLVPHHANELEAMTTSMFREADWFVTGEGVVRGERYPNIVRARRPIALSGAGKQLDGTWYCRAACHRWAREANTEAGEESNSVTRRYEVDVTLVRNGLGPDAPIATTTNSP